MKQIIIISAIAITFIGGLAGLSIKERVRGNEYKLIADTLIHEWAHEVCGSVENSNLYEDYTFNCKD